MALARATFFLQRASKLIGEQGKLDARMVKINRPLSTTKSGGIITEPRTTPFGLIGVVVAVVVGLSIGAAVSKNIANFLEENELFVPSDDDDDDD